MPHAIPATLIDPDRVRAGLGPRASSLDLQFFNETSSTNDRARDYLRSARPGAPIALISAETQSAGRGRFNRPWVSPPSVNLLFSLAIPAARLEGLAPETLNLAIAAALCAELESADPLLRPAIKWPNDVLLGSGKLAGALTESVTAPAQPTGQATPLGHALGVGINVNIAPEAWPEPLRATATSLLIETLRPWSREDLLAGLVSRWLDWLDLPEPARSREAFDSWRSRVLWIGCPVIVRVAETATPGLAVTVNPDGSLVFRPDGGGPDQILRAGEVSLRAPETTPTV